MENPSGTTPARVIDLATRYRISRTRRWTMIAIGLALAVGPLGTAMAQDEIAPEAAIMARNTRRTER